MADQNAIQDDNKVSALTAHSGTAGTAETKRITSSGTPGALDVHIVGTAVDISGAAAGTNVNIVTGTQQTLGTVGTVSGIGTLTNIGSISNIGTMPAVGGGTQFAEDAIHSSGAGGNIALAVRTDGGTALAADGDYHILETDANGALRISGTVATGAGTQAVRLIDGTTTLVSSLASGTITAGTVAVTTGTIVGNIAEAGSVLGNPVRIAGVDVQGTGNIRTLLTDTTGRLRLASDGTISTTNTGTNVNIVTGTINVGTATVSGNVGVSTGTITTLPMTPAGTFNMGDVDVLTLPNLPGGSVAVTALPNTPGGTLGLVTRVGNIGTIESGTVTTTMGDLTGGTIDLGTVVGANAAAGTSTTSPVQVGGTTATGTVYGMLIDTAGNPQMDVVAIPQVSVGTLPTLNLTTGTITTGSLSNIAMLHAGTIASVGTIPGVGVVTSVTNLVGGTIGSVIGIGGTVKSILQAANGIDIGNVDVATGTITSVTNLAGGTVQVNPKSPIQVLTASALGTTGGTMTGTLSAASGAGTSHYVTGLQVVVNSGTTDVYLGFGTTTTGGSVLARGMFVPGGGIMRDFTFPIQSGTNSEVCYIIAGAGTALVAVNYWKGT